MVTVQCLISIATVQGLDLHQFDVNSAFLHGDLREEVYMRKPLGLQLFTKRDKDSFMVLLAYVDNILVASNRLDSIAALKQLLGAQFKIKRPWDFKVFSWDRDSDTLASKPMKIPMDQNVRLRKGGGKPLSDPISSRRLIGRLMYLTITRLDINYTVLTLSQFMTCPTTAHLVAAYKVLLYINSASGQGIFFSASAPLQLQAYCDSDWAFRSDSRRSITKYCIFIGHSLISWKFKKRIIVSRSSAESEYQAMATTCSELMWLRYLLHDLQISHPKPALLFCDNQAALDIATNPVFHERTKHIEIDCHLIHDKILEGNKRNVNEDGGGSFYYKNQGVRRHAPKLKVRCSEAGAMAPDSTIYIIVFPPSFRPDFKSKIEEKAWIEFYKIEVVHL
ncbi:uncharacterized protein LOC111383934 [Olea europaea var. sylvestris]|uniref:uncharacterized protein LOC111383934 n=1 Tax=Olea europaea var. sylvestris TaxID=158386 RepID=UPI000C1D636D|nr:uncharacterized protein LOC111383934 [Olea europaea var. sylvestris]